MYSNPQQNQNQEEVVRLRQEAGRYIRKLREACGYSQRDLSNRMNYEYYTFISQIESGRGRVPPHQYEMFAKALRVPLREFAKTLMSYYDPLTYHAVFGDYEDMVPATDTNALAERIARLESLLADKLA